MTGSRRNAIAIGLWALVVALAGAFVGVGDTAGQGLNHATLVIEFPDGRSETYCVGFTEDSISGTDLLDRSGLSVVFSGFGGLGAGVCRIDDVGCSDPGNCYCQCTGADCEFWTYYGIDDGEWRYQPIGPSTRILRDGDTDAWVWGSGRAPPVVSSRAVCAKATNTDIPLQPSATEGHRTDDGIHELISTPDPPDLTDPIQDGPSEEPMGGDEPTGSTEAGSVTEKLPTAEDDDQVSRVESGADEGDDSNESEQRSRNAKESSDRIPARLFVFGAIAALLFLAAGGVVLRRRRDG